MTTLGRWATKPWVFLIVFPTLLYCNRTSNSSANHGVVAHDLRGLRRYIRRAEAASDDRPRDRLQAEDTHFGRGDLRVGQHHPEEDRGLPRHAEMHADRHSAQAVYDTALRQDNRSGRRQDRRGRDL